MKKQFLSFCLVAFFCAAMLCDVTPAMAQRKKKEAAPVAKPATAQADTSKKTPAAAPGKDPVALDKFIKRGTPAKQGMFTVYVMDGKYYVEIPDSLMGRDILAVSRFIKAGAGMSNGFQGYAGDQINSNVIRFEKGPKNKVFLKKISHQVVSKESADMYESVKNSNMQPIYQAFDVKAFGKNSVLVDFTDFISSDSDILYFSTQAKRSFNLGNQQNDKSYIVDVKTFPINTEISVVKTYPVTPAQGASPQAAMMQRGPAVVTVELNCSMVLLPKEPMVARYSDPRVGFFATRKVDFDANPQGVKSVNIAVRWRLEPKAEDMEKYLRGELVEPEKPIIFYIDPTTPKKWVPYLIAGVNDWQVAFEKAGFKNAIMALEAPVGDSTWSLEDARHSAIVYKASDVANASGPNVNDPRSGEIIESHINWYHNVMKLLHHWYFIQCGAVDKDATLMTYPDELMGELIRFVSSHEVGHTLGLRHNFGSSWTYATDSLRNIDFLKRNGFAPSIMDYARFNSVAQPEDNIPRELLFPRINHYDQWAIEWGYRYYPQFKTPEEAVPYLSKLVTERTAGNKYLWFGTETNPDDPRSQAEDVGDNAMKSSDYSIKNLKKTFAKLIEYTKIPNESYAMLEEMYNEYTNQLVRYIGHVSKNIGGIYETPKKVEEPGAVYSFVPKTTQREALNWINNNVFTTPVWLLNNKIFELTGNNGLSVMTNLQGAAVNRLLSARVLQNMLLMESALGATNAYRTSDYFGDLNRMVWSNLEGNIDIYKRNLQKLYVKRLIALYPSKTTVQTQSQQSMSMPQQRTPEESEVAGIAFYQLKQLQKKLKTVATANADVQSKGHLEYLATLIDEAFAK